jgi:hypothetical protein
MPKENSLASWTIEISPSNEENFKQALSTIHDDKSTPKNRGLWLSWLSSFAIDTSYRPRKPIQDQAALAAADLYMNELKDYKTGLELLSRFFSDKGYYRNSSKQSKTARNLALPLVRQMLTNILASDQVEALFSQWIVPNMLTDNPDDTVTLDCIASLVKNLFDENDIAAGDACYCMAVYQALMQQYYPVTFIGSPRDYSNDKNATNINWCERAIQLGHRGTINKMILQLNPPGSRGVSLTPEEKHQLADYYASIGQHEKARELYTALAAKHDLDCQEKVLTLAVIAAHQFWLLAEMNNPTGVSEINKKLKEAYPYAVTWQKCQAILQKQNSNPLRKLARKPFAQLLYAVVTGAKLSDGWVNCLQLTGPQVQALPLRGQTEVVFDPCNLADLRQVSKAAEAVELWYCQIKPYFSRDPHYVFNLAKRAGNITLLSLKELAAMTNRSTLVVDEDFVVDWVMVKGTEKDCRHVSELRSDQKRTETAQQLQAEAEAVRSTFQKELSQLLAGLDSKLLYLKEIKKTFDLDPENVLENEINILLNLGQLYELSDRADRHEKALFYYVEAFNRIRAGTSYSSFNHLPDVNLALPHIKRLAEKKLPSAVMKLALLAAADVDTDKNDHHYEQAAQLAQQAIDLVPAPANPEWISNANSFRLFGVLHKISMLPYWQENKVNVGYIQHVLTKTGFYSCAKTREKLQTFAKSRLKELEELTQRAVDKQKSILCKETELIDKTVLIPRLIIPKQSKPLVERKKPFSLWVAELPPVDTCEKNLYTILSHLHDDSIEILQRVTDALSSALPQPADAVPVLIESDKNSRQQASTI